MKNRHSRESGNLSTKTTGISAFAGVTLALLFFGIGSMVRAQPTIQLRTEVSPREIYIGDVIQYRVTVIFSSDVASAPLSPAATFGDFELLGYAPPQPQMDKERRTQMTHEIAMTTFSTGTLTIPPFALLFATADGKQAEAKTEPVTITVKSLLQEKGDLGGLRPLKGLFNFRSFLWIWLTLAGIIAAVLGYLLYRKIQRNRLNGPVSNEPPQPPEETALDAIGKLEASELLANGQIKEFYYRLSIILRTYLERRYRISALDRTTAELSAEFRRLAFNPDILLLSREFLDSADLVKFAKLTPTPEEITADVGRVKLFVEKTTPKPASPQEAKPEEVPL